MEFGIWDSGLGFEIGILDVGRDSGHGQRGLTSNMICFWAGFDLEMKG